MTLTELLAAKVVDVLDFPTPGIVFKDISPLLADHDRMRAIGHAALESPSRAGAFQVSHTRYEMGSSDSSVASRIHCTWLRWERLRARR